MLQKIFNIKLLALQKLQQIKRILKSYLMSMAKKVGNLLHVNCNGGFMSLKDKFVN